MPTTITLSAEQEAAVRTIERWFHDPHGTDICSVAGYAGTGKSTVVNHVIDELGLSRSRVAFLAYTGKAALVLRSKGLPAQTIHSLIYSVEDDGFGLRFIRRAELEQLYDLLVVDEVSMVNRDLLEDLRSFGIPILALGDPAQLPPVEGGSSGILDRPDAFLREIHRQVKDSPILWASMLARQGDPVPRGDHGEELRVVLARDVWNGTIDINSFDQIICCTNKLRRKLNDQIREIRGFSGQLPQVGERILSFRNFRDAMSTASQTPLVNGLQGTVTQEPWEVSVERERGLIGFEIDDGDAFSGIPSDLCRFLRDEDNPDSASHNARSPQFDFGYAITAHKSQGSEWERVLVIVSDIFGDPDDRRRLLYTAITRASRHLTLAVREGQA